MMEEIIATADISGAALGEVLFPKLEVIIIKDMQKLKTIWHCIMASNSLPCFKMLQVKNCEKIEKIFPEYMNRAFASVETLKVEDCKSVKEIFQLGVNEDHTTQLKYITVLRLPQLKQIWSRGSQSRLHFKNLKVVRVEDCGDLEYLFPFFIAQHLPQLETIIIKNAERMKEIVFDREEPLDNLVEFEFNRLTSIVLINLHGLLGFCVGNHSLFCSSLKTLEVYNCQKLKLFKKQDASSQGRLSDVNLHISTQQPLFTLEEVIDNLENLCLNNEDARMICQSQVPGDQFRKLKFLHLSKLADAQGTSPYWFLQNMCSLEWLVIGGGPFKVIFPHQMPQDENGEIDIKTRLKKLTLLGLDELQHICKEGCQLDPVLDVLECLYVYECSNLKHLVPSSVTFNHLKYLEVKNCSGLIYLMTSSTAQSMVKLTTLKIRECDLIKRILEEDGRESNSEIEFSVLEVLELESLPKLNSFCSSNCSLKLPLLEKLVIRQCPRLKAFATSGTSSPILREILTDENDGKWFCYGDLNSTVNKIFQQKAIEEGVEGGYRESINISKQSSHIHQNSAGTSRALSSKERVHGAKSKADETVYNSAMGTEKMNEDTQTPFIETDHGTQDEAIDRPLVQAIHQDSAIESSPSQAPQAVASSHQAVGTQETYKSKGRFSVHDAQNILSPTMVYDREMDEATEKSLIQTTQEAQSPATIHDIEESQDSEACLRDNSCNQSTTFVIGDKKQISGTQEIHDTIQTNQNTKSLATTQNAGICDTVILNSTMIHDAAIDPSPSKSPEPATTSILELDACSAYKLFTDISEQNLPHLEAGVKRHPQLLDWFNTKRRRRVFATLFTEVTRILRTTRLRDLTKDDRDYITECCAALEAVGFDASWLSYVNKCIESCGDGDELKIKLEEMEVKASSLRNELASVEASLAVLRDEASRLDNFIES